MSVEFAQILMEPAYRKVASAIGGRILDRSLRDGDRLPPETELARQFGVNRSTVREALRELESNGLVKRRPGSKLMSVSRPQHGATAGAVTRALVLHDVTALEVWEALTLIEPPIAEVAARMRTEDDLEQIAAVCARFAATNSVTDAAVDVTAQFFRSIGRATHNQVLELAQEPLIQLLEASLRLMIDKVPQARNRILTAQRRICDALRARDAQDARSWMTRHVRDFRRGYEIAAIDLTHRVTID